MKVAIIDADLVSRKKHRFPNLVCMKLSGWHKENGDEVSLKLDYDSLLDYDIVYISKVFTDTKVPTDVLRLENVVFGGTGFYYDTAPKLPEQVEHHKPDYSLYSDWVKSCIEAGASHTELAAYTDYSIGFLTRGCFRHCDFCVNKNYNAVNTHSPLDEFVDADRPKICLLDDNFLGCPEWKRLLGELKATGKPFQFKQGLDERLLTEEKCAELFSSKYDGDYIFAFDNVADKDLIERKIHLARQYTNAVLKFYCLTGFDRDGKWDADFWRQDIFDLFTRIEILMRNGCLPYIMRFNRYTESPYRGVYVSVARWCNQPAFFKKKSLREFSEANGAGSACTRYLAALSGNSPEISRFYDLKFER